MISAHVLRHPVVEICREGSKRKSKNKKFFDFVELLKFLRVFIVLKVLRVFRGTQP